MKRNLSIVAIFMAISVLFSSCGSFGGGTTTATKSAGYTTGQAFGTSFLALYTQYKGTGKIDMNNPTTLLNVASLASNCGIIKQNLTNKTFYSDFVSGAVFGSKQTMSSSTVDQTINALGNLDLTSIINAVGGNSTSVPNNTATTVTNTLITLFNGLNK